MNSPRFDRFAQPQYLQRIGRERLTQILLPFAPELLAHGIALPATALPDELFFQVLAALVHRVDGVSAKLQEAMTAIEVIHEVFPDEVTASPAVPAGPGPLVVSEIRLRLSDRARPVLLIPAAQQGLVDERMNGLREGTFNIEHSTLNIEGETVAAAEPRPSNEDGGLMMDGVQVGTFNIEHSTQNTEPGTARGDGGSATGHRPTSETLLAELREQRALLAKLNAQVGSLAKDLPARKEGESPGPVNEAGAVAVFALIVKLDAQGKQKAPSPLTVFRHYCIEGLSAEQVASKCRCSKGTVMGRLRLIERTTRKKPESFRAMSDHLQRLDDNYTRTGAREIYRRGLVDGDD